MENDLISVIVPIYNVEKYLNKCLDSIINQTYKNLEIILIDDGSPDKCPQICDEYAKKDKRVKVIHKLNGGLSSARNTGIDIANGKYISFVDSDDYIDKRMLEKLHKNIIETKSELAICNLFYVYDKKKSAIEFEKENFIVSGTDKFKNLYNRYNIVTILASNKLYSKTIFKDIRYKNGIVNEDEEIIFKILDKTNKVSYINDKLYYYVQRNDSIMHKFNLKRLDIMKIHEERIENLILKKNNELLRLEYLSYIQVIIKTILPGLESIKEIKKYKEVEKRLKSLIVEVKTKFTLNIKTKIKLNIIYLSPKWYFKIFKKK